MHRSSQPNEASIAIGDPVELLSRHRKKLTALRLESGYNEAHFRTFVYDPLLECARYVHDIPASRAENHREPGGLLRFSLETAFLAFRRADGKLFPAFAEADISSRDVDLTWRYSAFVAGLCLSLGRAAAVVTVRSQDGREIWNPYAGGLVDWALCKNLDGYVIDWKNRQDARSPTLASIWFAAKLLDKGIMEKLFFGEGQIVEAVLDVVMGRADSALSELVSESVNSVIDQDLSSSRQSDGLPTTGISVEHRILDAIRGLIRDKWTLNSAGSRMWVTEQGVFINWKPAVNDIVVRLRADGVSGIPNDADTVAELLTAKTILSINEHTTTLPHYFRIVVHAPHVPKHPLDCVHLVNPMLLGLQLDAVSRLNIEIVGQPAENIVADDNPQGEFELAASAEESVTPQQLAPSSESPPLRSPKTPDNSTEEPSSSTPATADLTAPTALARYGEVGKVLEALVQDGGMAFLRVNDGIALAYPGGLEPVCERPKEFLSSCRTQSLLVAESGNPDRVVRKRRKTEKELPDQYIVLVPRLAKSLGIPGHSA
ncbi:MAG: MobH family relaxase [Pseudomonadales bacterium]